MDYLGETTKASFSKIMLIFFALLKPEELARLLRSLNALTEDLGWALSTHMVI